LQVIRISRELSWKIGTESLKPLTGHK